MPPVTAAPKADEPVAESSLTEVLRKRIDAIDAKERTGPEKQFLRAIQLEGERSDTLKKIASNREYLRLMEANGEFEDDADLADWLEDFYPTKEKGARRSEDEVERTRKARAAARK